MSLDRKDPNGSERLRHDQLPRAAFLTGWPTARAADGEKNVRSLDGSLSEIERKGTPQDLAMGAALASWPTPSTMDSGNTGTAWEERRDRVKADLQNGNGFGLILPMASQLSAWPTPTVSEATAGARPPDAKRGPAPGMHERVQLVAWPTPNAMEGGQTSRSGARKSELLMGGLAQLAAWSTSMANDGGGKDYTRDKGDPDQQRWTNGGLLKDLAGTQLPARLTACGEMRIGSDAATKSGGQLNPEHSLWLMLGPFGTAWASCGERVTRSRSGKRKASSPP